MPNDNYFKPTPSQHKRLAPDELFFFDSNNASSIERAFQRVTAATPPGKPIAVWHMCLGVPQGVVCVGHAPDTTNVDDAISYGCANCGRRYPRWGEQ
jgi:hypothetical protein